jgi:hypothetical protein
MQSSFVHWDVVSLMTIEILDAAPGGPPPLSG